MRDLVVVPVVHGGTEKTAIPERFELIDRDLERLFELACAQERVDLLSLNHVELVETVQPEAPAGNDEQATTEQLSSKSGYDSYL